MAKGRSLSRSLAGQGRRCRSAPIGQSTRLTSADQRFDKAAKVEASIKADGRSRSSVDQASTGPTLPISVDQASIKVSIGRRTRRSIDQAPIATDATDQRRSRPTAVGTGLPISARLSVRLSADAPTAIRVDTC
jgi:hypothetical protein